MAEEFEDGLTTEEYTEALEKIENAVKNIKDKKVQYVWKIISDM